MPLTSACHSGLPRWTTCSPRCTLSASGWAVTRFFHFRVWYRDELANYVREILFDPRSLARPYLKPEAVRTIVNGHLKGNRNYTTEIHRLLSLELTHRLFVDSR